MYQLYVSFVDATLQLVWYSMVLYRQKAAFWKSYLLLLPQVELPYKLCEAKCCEVCHASVRVLASFVGLEHATIAMTEDSRLLGVVVDMNFSAVVDGAAVYNPLLAVAFIDFFFQRLHRPSLLEECRIICRVVSCVFSL